MDSLVLSAVQMRALEKAAFERGITAEALMDEAGAGIARAVARFFPVPGRCLVFAGKGNNAGDAVVAAEHLSRSGWRIEMRLSFEEKDCGELMEKKLQSLRAGLRRSELPLVQGRADSPRRSPSTAEAGARPSTVIVLDGLLGLGAKPPLREPIRSACREINQLRREENAHVFAVDLPTGLDGDSGRADRDCVVADFTVTVAFAKRGLVADSATNFVGRIEVIDLSKLRTDMLPRLHGRAEPRPSDIVATVASLRDLLPRRKYDAYKNQFGRVGIVAGSKGFSGAAIMCSSGALRAGAGLVEIFVPEEIYEIVAGAAPVEAMVKPIRSYRDLPNESIDGWGVGPGLGRERAEEIMELVQTARQPMVVDADALNILSRKTSLLKHCRGPRLLTPQDSAARPVPAGQAAVFP